MGSAPVGVPLTTLDEACARRGRAVAALLPLSPSGLMPDDAEVPDLPGNPFQNVPGEKALLPFPPVLLASPSLPPPPGENKDVPNLRAGRGRVSAKTPSGVAHVTPGLCPSRCPAAHRGDWCVPRFQWLLSQALVTIWESWWDSPQSVDGSFGSPRAAAKLRTPLPVRTRLS